MNTGRLITFFLLLSASSLGAFTPALDPLDDVKADPQFHKGTYMKLQSDQIDVHWEDIDLQSALDELAVKSKKLDPERVGIKFIVKAGTLDQEKAILSRTVNITLLSTSIPDILEYVGQQTNLGFRVRKGVVILMSAK